MKKEEALSQRQWYVIDAQGKVLGRMATEIAKVLRGKHKPIFTPNQDAGDFVIVVNARGIKLTGTKLEKKIYYRHTEYPGGIRERTAAQMLAEKAGGTGKTGGEGNVAEEPVKQEAGDQAQSLCRPRASARCAKTPTFGDRSIGAHIDGGKSFHSNRAQKNFGSASLFEDQAKAILRSMTKSLAGVFRPGDCAHDCPAAL